MRKLTVILILLCYLVPALGFSVRAHYCGGKLASVSINLSKNQACACGSKKALKSCCQDKTCIIKTSSSHQQASYFNVDFDKHFEFKSPVSTVSAFKAALYDTGTFVYVADSSPPPTKEALFLLHRVFRI